MRIQRWVWGCLVLSVQDQVTFSLCLWNDRRLTGGSTCYQTAVFLKMEETAWAGKPLFVFAYQWSAYFVCAVIPPSLSMGEDERLQPWPKLTEARRDKTIATVIEKSLINVQCYRCAGRLRGITPHGKFCLHGKTFIRSRIMPVILIAGAFYFHPHNHQIICAAKQPNLQHRGIPGSTEFNHQCERWNWKWVYQRKKY